MINIDKQMIVEVFKMSTFLFSLTIGYNQREGCRLAWQPHHP